jgi:hypothetical protein
VCFTKVYIRPLMKVIKKNKILNFLIYYSREFYSSLCTNTNFLKKLSYFIEYNVHMCIVHIWISQWFLSKKNFKNNFTIINHCKFIHHKSHLKPLLSNLPYIVHREYFNIIFNVKKCALYSIKYGSLQKKLWKKSFSLHSVLNI